MQKIKFNTDVLSAVVQHVFNNDDVNTTIEDSEYPSKWIGKTLTEVLNVKYYSFKHRALSTKEKIKDLKKQDPDLDVNVLSVLDRSFCFVELDPIKRLFSKDIDELEISGTLQYWIQTDKIKILEELIENSNLATCGQKVPIVVNNISRDIVIYFDTPEVSSIEESEIGESCIATVGVTILLYPQISNMSDWKVQFLMTVDGQQKYVDLPIKNIVFNNSMVGKSVPRANKSECSDQVNLSNTTSVTLVFDGYKDNEVVKMLVSDTLSRGSLSETKISVNKLYSIKIIRDTVEYPYLMKISQYAITLPVGIENESHSLTLTTGRSDYGNQ